LSIACCGALGFRCRSVPRRSDAVEIEIDGGFRAHAPSTEDPFEQFLHRARHPQLMRAAQFLRALGGGGAGQGQPAARQQFAPAVDDRDVLRAQPRHGGGYEVQHRLHPFAIQPLRAGHGQHHARLRFPPLAGEGLAARQHQTP
jgi:hypothetical protein